MGAVYKARDLTLQIDVAVKVLRSKQAPEQALARFQQEAKTASRLNHPGIVKILDFGVVDGEMPYMVLEYVDGNSLATLIKEKGPLSLEEALPLFIATAEALVHAHGEGVLHRDLKPENVMVLGQDQIKLLDFGIAKFVENEGSLAVTSTGALVGSPLYMSPEQARGRGADKNVDCRSDIYSLGVLMFKTLSGRVPIQADSVIETIALKTSQPAPLLSSTGTPSNDELDRILTRCLAIEPEKRYDSVEELLKDLSNLYVEEESQSFPEGKTASSATVRSGSRWTLLLGAALILSAVGCLFFCFSSTDSQPPAPRLVNVVKRSETPVRTSADFLRDEGQGFFTVSEGADPDTFTLLAAKPLLKEVAIKMPELTEAMLAPLKSTSITSLEQITLEDVANLSSGVLSEIASIKSLKRLRFVDCKGFDREGLEALSRLPRLNRLFLEYSQSVDDQSISVLSKFPRMNRLSLRMTGVTPAGLANLPKDRTYVELDIAQLGLKDADLSSLEKLKLKSVNLSHNKLTFNGIRSFLKQHPKMTEITLNSIDLTKKEKLQLNSEYPELIIHINQEHYLGNKVDKY